MSRALPRLCLAILLAIWSLTPVSAGPRLSLEQRNVLVAGRTIATQIVRVPLSAYQMKVRLAHGRVGATEPVASIGLRHGAEAAINGCFFNAYTRDPIKPPYHHLVTGGALVHTGNTGTTLGFDGAGHYRMEQVRIHLLGGLDGQWGYPHNWYAYFMNHPVESSSAAIIYTSHWATARTPACRWSFGAAWCRASAKADTIPPDGYVLALAGRERYLAGRFQIGRRVDYRRVIKAEDPAVGLARDNTLLLMTSANATIVELAGMMRALGAYDAMNLDGGASSALWAQGRYLTAPGRDASHALVIVRRP